MGDGAVGEDAALEEVYSAADGAAGVAAGDDEAVPNDAVGVVVVGLVEEATCVLTVEDGGVRLKVTVGEVVGGGFDALESTIDIHTCRHDESGTG